MIKQQHQCNEVRPMVVADTHPSMDSSSQEQLLLYEPNPQLKKFQHLISLSSINAMQIHKKFHNEKNKIVSKSRPFLHHRSLCLNIESLLHVPHKFQWKL
jgi:hypothetical protein